MHFKMLSTICFNLDQSEIMSSDNGLNKKKKCCLILDPHYVLADAYFQPNAFSNVTKKLPVNHEKC